MNKIIIGLSLFFFMLTMGSKHSARAAVPDTLNSSSLEYEYAFEEAIKQFNFGNYSQALYLFKKCIEVNNKSAASFYQASNIYLMAGDSKSALDLARSAFILDNSNKWIGLLLIKCFQLVDKNDSAVLVMEKILKFNQDNLDLRYEYGNLLANVGKYSEAIACYNDIDRKIGLNEGTALARHQIYLQNRDYNSAIKELENLVKEFPTEIRYLGMLAELYSSMHNTIKAKEVYKQIFEMDSTNNLALISITDFYRGIKEYSKAEIQLRKVLADNDIQLDSKLGLIIGYIRNDSDLYANQLLVRQAISQLSEAYPSEIKIDKLLVDYFIRTKDYDSAVIAIEKFIQNEESNEIWEQYFLLLNAKGKFERIIQQFSSAKKHAAEMPGIYIIAAIANMQTNNYAGAVTVLNEGLILQTLKDTEKVEMLQYKAESLFKLKDYVNSDSCFDEILKIEPLNYLVLNNYSYYLALRDTELEKASKMAKKVVLKFPSNATYIDTYAFVLMKMKKYSLASKWMKKAVMYNTKGDAEIFEHMGDILFYKGKRAEAIDFWNKARDKGRTDIIIEEKIKSLKK